MYQIIKQLLEDIDEMNYRYQHVKINGGVGIICKEMFFSANKTVNDLLAVHSIFIKMLNPMSKILIII